MNTKKLFIGTGVALLITAGAVVTFGLIEGSLSGIVLIALGLLIFITGLELVIHPNIEDFLQVVYAVANFFSPGPYITPPSVKTKKNDK